MDMSGATLFSIALAALILGNTWTIVRLLRDADEVRILRRQAEESAHVMACIKALMSKWAETWPDARVRQDLLEILKQFEEPPPQKVWKREGPRYAQPTTMGMDFGVGLLWDAVRRR